ncbi:hypothetical protein HK102_006594 [Quaeritorhiza haematococci]|nr:hypothetical protein HK102_006594 [Quaeritorhiza haematococci]
MKLHIMDKNPTNPSIEVFQNLLRTTLGPEFRDKYPNLNAISLDKDIVVFYCHGANGSVPFPKQARLAPNMFLRIERVDSYNARVYLVDNKGVVIPDPDVSIYDRTNEVVLEPWAVYELAWGNDYAITWKGEELLTLETGKRWTVRGAPAVSYINHET